MSRFDAYLALEAAIWAYENALREAVAAEGTQREHAAKAALDQQQARLRDARDRYHEAVLRDVDARRTAARRSGGALEVIA